VADVTINELKRRMDGALEALRREFAGLRTGRASAHLLDHVMVKAYGGEMPINQVGNVNVPEPRLISVQVWDRGLVISVEKAIREAGLGLNPISDGQLVRVPIHELSQERRHELTKIAHKYAEQGRVAVRNVRRDGMDQLKKAKAAGMAEDDHKMWHDEIQELTDAAIKKIDTALNSKQEEIMQF
jgi:ribosome recycling factor